MTNKNFTFNDGIFVIITHFYECTRRGICIATCPSNFQNPGHPLTRSLRRVTAWISDLLCTTFYRNVYKAGSPMPHFIIDS